MPVLSFSQSPVGSRGRRKRASGWGCVAHAKKRAVVDGCDAVRCDVTRSCVLYGTLSSWTPPNCPVLSGLSVGLDPTQSPRARRWEVVDTLHGDEAAAPAQRAASMVRSAMLWVLPPCTCCSYDYEMWKRCKSRSPSQLSSPQPGHEVAQWLAGWLAPRSGRGNMHMDTAGQSSNPHRQRASTQGPQPPLDSVQANTFREIRPGCGGSTVMHVQGCRGTRTLFHRLQHGIYIHAPLCLVGIAH